MLRHRNIPGNGGAKVIEAASRSSRRDGQTAARVKDRRGRQRIQKRDCRPAVEAPGFLKTGTNRAGLQMMSAALQALAGLAKLPIALASSSWTSNTVYNLVICKRS